MTEAGPWSGRSTAEWAEWLAVPHLELHAELPSTNRRLRELGREGAEPFTTVVAETQTRGRGREGKDWHSPAGTGLWLSVLLPLPRWGSGAVLPLAVGVATARVVEEVTDRAAGLKWPNDVITDGRKVAGILCESLTPPDADGPASAVVGIGMNLRPPPGGFPSELSRIAGCLEALAGGPLVEPEVARRLLDELRAWAHPAPSELSGRLRVEWEARDLLRDRRVQIDRGEKGTAAGVSPEGALRLVRSTGDLLTVRSGSVRLAEEGADPALASPPISPRDVESR